MGHCGDNEYSVLKEAEGVLRAALDSVGEGFWIRVYLRGQLGDEWQRCLLNRYEFDGQSVWSAILIVVEPVYRVHLRIVGRDLYGQFALLDAQPA